MSRTIYETKGIRISSFEEPKLSDKLDSQLTPGHKEYKTYFVDRHTIYVNNNSHNEVEVLKRLRGALQNAPHRVGTPLPENHHILTSTYVKRSEEGKKGEKGYRGAEDKTLVYFYDSRDYDYLLCIDSETGIPLVTIDGVRNGTSLSEPLKSQMEKELSNIVLGSGIGSWADAEEDQEALIWKYYLLAIPLKEKGISIIPRDYRKSWKSHLKEKGDIGILRCTSTKCRPQFYENRLVIQNIPPSWTQDETKTYFSKFSTSSDPLYPHFEFKMNKDGTKPMLFMTFDPRHKEAMFAQQLLRDARLYVKATNKYFNLNCSYFFINNSQGQSPNGGVYVIHPPKKQHQPKEVDSDGFRTRR